MRIIASSIVILAGAIIAAFSDNMQLEATILAMCLIVSGAACFLLEFFLGLEQTQLAVANRQIAAITQSC